MWQAACHRRCRAFFGRQKRKRRYLGWLTLCRLARDLCMQKLSLNRVGWYLWKNTGGLELIENQSQEDPSHAVQQCPLQLVLN